MFFIFCDKLKVLSIFQSAFSVGDKLLYFKIVESFFSQNFCTQKFSYMARLSRVGPFPCKLWARLEQSPEIYSRLLYNAITAQKMKFSIKDFFNKCEQIRKKPRIWSHVLKKSLIENFIFCMVNNLFAQIKINQFFYLNTIHFVTVYCMNPNLLACNARYDAFCKILHNNILLKFCLRYSMITTTEEENLYRNQLLSLPLWQILNLCKMTRSFPIFGCFMYHLVKAKKR